MLHQSVRAWDGKGECQDADVDTGAGVDAGAGAGAGAGVDADTDTDADADLENIRKYSERIRKGADSRSRSGSTTKRRSTCRWSPLTAR